MQVTTNRKLLRTVIDATAHLVDRDGHIALGATADTLEIVAPDLFQALLQVWIPADVQETGEAHVARTGFKRTLSGGGAKSTVHISTGPDIGALVRTEALARVPEPARPHPDPRKLAEETPAGICLGWNTAQVSEMLRITAPCMNDEETRRYLNGVFLHPNDDGTVTGVATNGHILARHVSDLPSRDPDGWTNGRKIRIGNHPGPGAIIPRDTVQALGKLIRCLAPESIVVQMDPDSLLVRFSGTSSHGAFELTCTAIDGVYPRYDKVIPMNLHWSADLDPNAWIKTLRGSGMKTTDHLILNTGAHLKDLGSQKLDPPRVTLPEGLVDMQDAELGFSAAYFRNTVQAFAPGGDCTMHQPKGNKPSQSGPVLFTSKSMPETTVVVMSLRI